METKEIEGKEYQMSNGVLYTKRLTVKGDSLAFVWYKVCMSNGFSLIKSIKIIKAFNN